MSSAVLQVSPRSKLTLVHVNLALSRPIRSEQPERGPYAAPPRDVRHVDGDESADVEVGIALDPHAVTVGARGKSRVAVNGKLGDSIIDRDEAEALGFGAVDVAARRGQGSASPCLSPSRCSTHRTMPRVGSSMASNSQSSKKVAPE